MQVCETEFISYPFRMDVSVCYLAEESVGQVHILLEKKTKQRRDEMVPLALMLRCSHICPGQDVVRRTLLTLEWITREALSSGVELSDQHILSGIQITKLARAEMFSCLYFTFQRKVKAAWGKKSAWSFAHLSSWNLNKLSFGMNCSLIFSDVICKRGENSIKHQCHCNLFRVESNNPINLSLIGSKAHWKKNAGHYHSNRIDVLCAKSASCVSQQAERENNFAKIEKPLKWIMLKAIKYFLINVCNWNFVSAYMNKFNYFTTQKKYGTFQVAKLIYWKLMFLQRIFTESHIVEEDGAALSLGETLWHKGKERMRTKHRPNELSTVCSIRCTRSPLNGEGEV